MFTEILNAGTQGNLRQAVESAGFDFLNLHFKNERNDLQMKADCTGYDYWYVIIELVEADSGESVVFKVNKFDMTEVEYTGNVFFEG